MLGRERGKNRYFIRTRERKFSNHRTKHLHHKNNQKCRKKNNIPPKKIVRDFNVTIKDVSSKNLHRLVEFKKKKKRAKTSKLFWVPQSFFFVCGIVPQPKRKQLKGRKTSFLLQASFSLKQMKKKRNKKTRQMMY